MIKTYLILDTGANLIKIGKAKCVESRLKQIQANCGSLLVVKHVFDDDIEVRLHRAFKHKRKHGEWFDISADEVINFMCDAKSKVNHNFNVTSLKSKSSTKNDYPFDALEVGECFWFDTKDTSINTMRCRAYKRGVSLGKKFSVDFRNKTVSRIA